MPSVKIIKLLINNENNRFIVNMIYAFQDYDNLYLVMDLISGGDLRYHLQKHKKFSEDISTSLILGLEYIHSCKIMHRDIKPENLVVEDKGFIRLTDFGIAKVVHPNIKETSGTMGYMAPEVIMGQPHSYPVDYFAVGVLTYEFMFGSRPFYGRNRQEIKQDVITRQARVNKDEVPDDWSKEAGSFINALLTRKPEKRLGSENGIDELKYHKWFKGFHWDKLRNKTMSTPFKPEPKKDNQKYKGKEDSLQSETICRYQEIMHSERYNNLFYGYTFINKEDEYLLIAEEKKVPRMQLMSSLNTKTLSNQDLTQLRISAVNSPKMLINGNGKFSLNMENYIEQNNFRLPQNTNRRILDQMNLREKEKNEYKNQRKNSNNRRNILGNQGKCFRILAPIENANQLQGIDKKSSTFYFRGLRGSASAGNVMALPNINVNKNANKEEFREKNNNDIGGFRIINPERRSALNWKNMEKFKK